MIFIHGLGQNSDSWKDVINTFQKDNHISVDLKELVSSKSIHNEITYSELYSAFCNYLNTVDGGLSLCGLSLGAVLALNYAIDLPDRVQHLVLIAPQYKMPEILLKFQSLIFRFMPSFAFKETGFSKKDFISLTSSMSHIDFTSGLDRVTCSTLIVCGAKDKANLKASMKLKGLMSNASLKIINGAGHELNKDAPKELAELILTFLP